ncbi:unnamed protein product [Closterium sp. NIES-64]|nr:unnamed protein product [Closterium sp. NIES-64]
MMFSRISLLRFPLRSVACAGCAPTGDPSPPPPCTVPPLTCHSPSSPPSEFTYQCCSCALLVDGRGVGVNTTASPLPHLPITHATRSSFPPLFSPCRSLGLKEQWQADVGQQASTWVALMPEAPGGSRQHGPSYLPDLAASGVSLVLRFWPFHARSLLLCVCALLVEGRGVGSTPTLPRASLLWPCRLLGVQQRRLSGGDGREAALQRIAIAATRESMAMGVACPLLPAPLPPPPSQRPVQPRLQQGGRGQQEGSRRVAGGQQEGSRRATGGRVWAAIYSSTAHRSHFTHTSKFLSSFLFPRISSPFTPPSSSPPPPSPRPFLSLFHSATLSSQQVAHMGVAVAGDKECTGSSCSPPNLHTAKSLPCSSSPSSPS